LKFMKSAGHWNPFNKAYEQREGGGERERGEQRR
jgi:hypothetical protein